MDDRAQQFARTYSQWRQQISRGVHGSELEESLSQDFRRAWNDGDVETKVDVLHYLAAAVPRDGVDIVWSGIEADDERIAGVALHAATRYVRSLGMRLDAKRIALLQRIVHSEWSEPTRMTALDVLEFAGTERLDPWLRTVAEEDASDRVRLHANIMLMRRGSRKATEAVLADIREHPAHFGVADDLWNARDKVALSDDEDRELRAVISRYVDWLQGRLRDRNEERDTRDMAASMLAKFGRGGFLVEAEDVEALYDLTVSRSRPADRIACIDALAALDMPVARGRIEHIARTDEAAEVREHARRVLG